MRTNPRDSRQALRQEKETVKTDSDFEVALQRGAENSLVIRGGVRGTFTERKVMVPCFRDDLVEGAD